MEGKATARDIPHLLRETLDNARSEYPRLIRETRWGQGPILFCPCGASSPLGLAGSYAFEEFLGWPTVARPARVFEHYASSLLQPKSVLLIISASGEGVELARRARAGGAVVLALTSDASNSLAQAAQGVFLVRAVGAEGGGATMACQHAALIYLALATARTLKRHNPQWDLLEEEFEKLPELVERTLTQLSSALRSLAAELAALHDFWVVGGGFYHAAALWGARRFQEAAGLRAEGVEASEFLLHARGKLERATLFLSSTRSKMKKTVHEAAAERKKRGGQVSAITDGNDRELVSRSHLALLVPEMSEVVGSTLTLALLESLAAER